MVPLAGASVEHTAPCGAMDCFVSFSLFRTSSTPLHHWQGGMADKIQNHPASLFSLSFLRVLQCHVTVKKSKRCNKTKQQQLALQHWTRMQMYDVGVFQLLAAAILQSPQLAACFFWLILASEIAKISITFCITLVCVLQFVAIVFQRFVAEQGTFDWAVRKVSAKQSIYLIQSFSQACDSAGTYGCGWWNYWC